MGVGRMRGLWFQLKIHGLFWNCKNEIPIEEEAAKRSSLNLFVFFSSSLRGSSHPFGPHHKPTSFGFAFGPALWNLPREMALVPCRHCRMQCLISREVEPSWPAWQWVSRPNVCPLSFLLPSFTSFAFLYFVHLFIYIIIGVNPNVLGFLTFFLFCHGPTTLNFFLSHFFLFYVATLFNIVGFLFFFWRGPLIYFF